MLLSRASARFVDAKMASKSHVDVGERRLRPIYDCLDNGNNKKALQEADKVLKKQKDFQCAKVLKGLALLRLGRHDESTVLLEEVHAQHPTEEATLQAMSICYREIHKAELIADMYENAHKARPENEEILSLLFMAYVRLGDYKKQQQTAMTLHRMRPNKNPYYFWAIMSIVMQAHTGDPKLAKAMFLPLAEKMADKYSKSGKIEAEAEVQMILIILELQGKYQEALDVIQGPLAEKLKSELNFAAVKTSELYAKLENWPEMNRGFRILLVENPDHWLFYTRYFDSIFKLLETNWNSEEAESSDNPVDNSVEKAVLFLQQQIDGSTKAERPMRGPYLAQLELMKRLKEQANPEVEKLGSAFELLKNYVVKFQDKQCCFADLKLYMGLLEDEETTKLLAELYSQLGLEVTGEDLIYATDVKHLQRHVTYLQLSRFTGQHDKLSIEDKMSLAKELVKRYSKGLEFGKELTVTDIQYSDSYLLMAAFLLVDVWEETGKDSVLWQVILLLEKGLKKSGSNHHFKLLLIRLYSTLGAFGPCATIYESLDIKHVQNDALGWCVSNHVARLGHFSTACTMYGTMLRFFTVNHKETTEHLITSYKYGAFTKIHEFVRFRERLQNSLQYASATVERLLLDLTLEASCHNNTEQILSYMEVDPEKDKTVFDELRDNRDLGVLPLWEPAARAFNEDLKTSSFREEKQWLKLRNLTLRSLAAAISIGKQGDKRNAHQNNNVGNSDGESKRSMAEITRELIEKLRTHLQESEAFSKPAKYPMQGPFRTRISGYLAGKHGYVIADMLENILYVQKLHEDGLETADDENEERMKTIVPNALFELVCNNKAGLVRGDGDNREFHPEVIESLVLIAETLSFITILAGVCHRLLGGFKTSMQKKRKKKKDTSAMPMPKSFTSFNAMLAGIDKASHDLHMAILETDPTLLSMDMSCLNLLDDSFSAQGDEEKKEESLEKEMWQKVEKSYQQSAKELVDFVQNKMRYLESLKL